ncbi:SMI1/KNR4 family protein [Streptomyces sannanensis]|uniref:SMI1/KNR4 family protein n=1 Tax=Streptomyces sannanensis TaxID=285536 RepID=A0ABP6S9L6_9ACTN
MDTDFDELLSALHHPVGPVTSEPVCARPGHGAGHACLELPDGLDLEAFADAVSGRFGSARRLDPATATARTGLPLVEPFGDRLAGMRVWAYARRWIGCGTVRTDEGGIRPVVLVAERADPAADPLPADADWVDRVVAVTGWDPARARTVDWEAVETRLGTALPSDYKRLAELFGRGGFDGYLSMIVPGGRSEDLVQHTEWLAHFAATRGNGLWEPYKLFPARGGLLEWANTEHETQFYWLTEGRDPDLWPIITMEDDRATTRFDCSTAELIFRMLTESNQPFSMAGYSGTHWFMGYGDDE